MTPILVFTFVSATILGFFFLVVPVLEAKRMESAPNRQTRTSAGNAPTARQRVNA